MPPDSEFELLPNGTLRFSGVHPQPVITTVRHLGNRFEVGVGNLEAGRLYKLFRSPDLRFQGPGLEVDSATAGGPSDTLVLIDDGAVEPLPAGSAFYRVERK